MDTPLLMIYIHSALVGGKMEIQLTPAPHHNTSILECKDGTLLVHGVHPVIEKTGTTLFLELPRNPVSNGFNRCFFL